MREFVIADLHFGHERGAVEFRGFESLEAMEKCITEKWHQVVTPQDRVYILGDIAFNNSALHRVSQLPGKKWVVLGNHDVFKPNVLLEAGFQAVRGSVVMRHCGALLTHIPVHPSELEGTNPRAKVNIHGHTHNKVVLGIDNNPDPRYVCVSCEQINYTPISFDKVTPKETT